jgi:hypothetical protein
VKRYNQRQADVYLTAIKAGATDDEAIAFAELDRDTLRAWRDRRPSFAAQVDKAKAEVGMVAIGQVRKAARDNWRASLIVAERISADRELQRLRDLTTDPA